MTTSGAAGSSYQRSHSELPGTGRPAPSFSIISSAVAASSAGPSASDAYHDANSSVVRISNIDDQHALECICSQVHIVTPGAHRECRRPPQLPHGAEVHGETRQSSHE